MFLENRPDGAQTGVDPERGVEGEHRRRAAESDHERFHTKVADSGCSIARSTLSRRSSD
jgi:hypothetical protein